MQRNETIDTYTIMNGFVSVRVICSPVQKGGIPGGGNGIILYRDGSAFVGYLKDGKRWGEGTFVHAATDVQYDGGWVDDHWHGKGSLYSVHDSTVLEGLWNAGELVGEGRRVDLGTGLTWTYAGTPTHTV